MAEAKLTVVGEDLATAVLEKVGKVLDETGQKAGGTGIQFDALKKATADLHPEATTASGVFEHMREAFEHPTTAAKQLATALVDDLGGGLGSIGVAAAAAAAGLAVVGVAAFELAEKAASAGGYLNDMSEKTGLSVPVLSKYSNALQVAGGDIGQFTNAIFMLQKGLGEGSEKVATGLGKIGLSTEELKAVGPDQYMDLIAEHMKATEDPAERAAAVMDIFGKAGKELIPTLLKLDDAMALTADAPVWTEQQARDAEHFEMQMKSLWLHAEALGNSIGKVLIPSVSWLVGTAGDAAHALGEMSLVIPAWHGLTETFGYAQAALAMFHHEADKTPEIANAAKLGVDKWLNSVKAGAIAIVKPGDGLAAALDTWKSADKSLTDQFNESHKANEQAQKDARELAKLYAEYDAVGASLTDTIDKMGGATVEGIRYDLERGVSQGTLQKIYGVTADQIRAIVAQEKEEAAELKEITERVEAFRKVGEDAAKGIGASLSAGGMGNVLKQLGTDLKVMSGEVPLAFKSITSAAQIGVMPDLSGLAKAHMDSYRITLTDGMDDLFERELPNVILGAVQGGGNIVASVGSAFGGQLGSNIAKQAAPVLEKSLGPMLGGALGNLIPGLGALVGPAIQGLAKLFGGVSQAEKDARIAVDDYEKSLTASLTAAQKVEAQGQQWRATNIAVRDAYLAVGKSEAEAQAAVDRLTAASHKSGAEAKAAEAEIESVIAAGKQRAQETAAGVSDIAAAATATGHAFPAALKPALDKLLEMKGLTEDQHKALNDLADGSKPDFDKLTSMAKGYGLELKDLGPKFQQANIDQTAKTLFDDFTDLTRAGADTGTVLHGMSGKIDQLVIDSKKFGTAIPDNMKPYLQQLVDSGELVDENGKKIGDLTGIKFEDTPIDSGFKSLATAIDKLTKALTGSGGVTDAIDAIQAHAAQIPANPFSDWHVPDVGSLRFDEGTSFANEGFDLSTPTRAIVGDNPMQSESVLQSSTVKDIVRAARNGGGDASTVTALRGEIAGLREQMKKQGDRLQSTLETLPAMMRHAIGTV